MTLELRLSTQIEWIVTTREIRLGAVRLRWLYLRKKDAAKQLFIRPTVLGPYAISSLSTTYQHSGIAHPGQNEEIDQVYLPLEDGD